MCLLTSSYGCCSCFTFSGLTMDILFSENFNLMPLKMGPSVVQCTVCKGAHCLCSSSTGTEKKTRKNCMRNDFGFNAKSFHSVSQYFIQKTTCKVLISCFRQSCFFLSFLSRVRCSNGCLGSRLWTTALYVRITACVARCCPLSNGTRL